MPRRNKSTDFLKECIADAMLQLMEEKPLKKITVKEITDTAGVGRATFFRHFDSKGDVLTFKLVTLWNRWAESRNLVDKSRFSLRTAEEMFAFNLNIKPIIAKIYEEEMQNTIHDAFYQIMEPSFGTDTVNSYANRFYSYGIFGLLDEWIKKGFRETPQEMADIVINEIVGKNISLR